MKLNCKIGEVIDDKGLKNSYLAKKMGVTHASVLKWRNEEAYPRIDKLFLLAKILDVKVDDLYTWEDDE